jgi:four helix bundle protein
MSEKKWVEIEELNVFAELEALCDGIWEEVMTWNIFAQRTIGSQLVDAADSVGANLVEGDGRYSHKEALHFFYIARGSLRETRLWIRRAARRGLLAAGKGQNWLERLERVAPQVNSLISTRKEWLGQVREEEGEYRV